MGALSDRRAATIYDVAAAAGVSAQTVSRYLTGYQGIRPLTREKVEEALSRLDYRPNLAARALATSRSHRLAMLTHEIDEVGPSRIMQGAAEAAREAGYLVDIVTMDATDDTAIREALEMVTAHGVAGVLALGSTDEMSRAFRQTAFSMPAYVGADDEPDPQLADIPEEHGLVDIVDHLVELGHERIAYIGGPASWAAARNRARTIRWAVARHRLALTVEFDGDWSSEAGYRAGRAVTLEDGVTAVVAANDQMALGALLALDERGIDIPREMSVTGIDDIPESAFLRPPLTTVRMDFAAQGRDAVEQLLALVEQRPSRPRAQHRPELVVRRSTGPARPRSA